MKKSISILALVALVIVAYSCRKNTDKLTTTATLNLPATPYVYDAIGGSFDPQANHKATLGRVLFYDAHLSLNNAISCGSCHKQAMGFADNAALSVGYEGRLTKRNSIGIADLSQSASLFWDGRENNLMNLSLRPISNHVEMGIEDMSALSAKLAALPYYKNLFTNAFGTDEISADRISQSIGMFLAAIQSQPTRLDDFVSGNTSALTAQEALGKTLFDTKYNCGSCHTNGGGGGSYNGGGGFQFIDIGLDNAYIDNGRGELTGINADKGTFKVPNLRNVGLTAPYMHDGRYKTLGDVIDHYSRGIMSSPNLDARLTDGKGHARSMNITEPDKQAIIAFLNTLTDYKTLTDPKFSNPFKAN